MRVCIDSRLISGLSGGVEQVVIGLALGLGALEDGDDEYLFLTDPAHEQWIRPYVQGPCRLQRARMPAPHTRRGRRGKELLKRRARPLHRAWERWLAPGRASPSPPPRSDGTVEAVGADVVHFPIQGAFLTDVPSVYYPSDLQHLHLPELFSARARAFRDSWYRAFCKQAAVVAMPSSWGKRDLMHQYGTPEEKVRVVPWGPVVTGAPAHPIEPDALRRELSLPDEFVLYPAQTWPHKNHIALLDALALLRQRSLSVPLVCTGRLTADYARIRRHVRRLQLGGQVHFLGYVDTPEMQGLFSLARGLVFPSRFEGWGMPVCEAFASGTPVACSAVTCLPDVAGDAALLFDPEDPEAIAQAVARLWTDEELRAELVARGNERAKLFTLDRAARHYRALYRRLAGRPLTEEDRSLLAAPPPV